jgi:hypothetical protein
LLSALTIANHHQQLLVSLLAPVASSRPATFKRFPHRRTFAASLPLQALPGLIIITRLPPGLNGVPKARGRTPTTARRRGSALPVAHSGVRRHGQQVALTPGRKPTTKPLRASHLIIPRNPAMRQPTVLVLQHVQGQLVPCAIPANLFLSQVFSINRRCSIPTGDSVVAL